MLLAMPTYNLTVASSRSDDHGLVGLSLVNPQ